MSLNECIRCWEIPCSCGYEYQFWETKKVEDLRDILTSIINTRQNNNIKGGGISVFLRTIRNGSKVYGNSDTTYDGIEIFDYVKHLLPERTWDPDRVLVNGNRVDMDTRLKAGDTVEVILE